MTHLCPSESELSRTLDPDGGARPPEPLASCAMCRSRWERLARAVRIARQLPADIPSPEQREQVRAELLARAGASWPRQVRPRAAWLVGASAAMGLLAVAIVIGGPALRNRQPRSRATVQGRPEADYAVASAPPNEALRLRDGTIRLDVEPLGPNERFRVLVGDDEIEVRGTSFAVVAEANRLLGVSVARGHVEVRTHGGRTTLLGPGEAWMPERSVPEPPIVAPALPRPRETERRRPPRARLARGEPARGDELPPARPRSDARETLAEEAEYDDAWDAMRAGDFGRAALGFGHVVAIAPDGALADEGAFWRAVAMGRDGAAPHAIVAFEQMLDRYPASPRRGEAAVILGWLLVDAHRFDEAARLFRSAENDPSPAVQSSARKGLARPAP